MTEGTVGAGLSLGSAVVWGAGDFSGGLASKRANVFRVVAVAHASGLLVLLVLAALSGDPFPSRAALSWGIAAGVVGAFGLASLYRGLAIGRMAIVAPIAAVLTAVLPACVGIAMDGLVDRIVLVGFALALVSVWLVARPAGDGRSRRGAGLAVAAGIFFGLFLIASKEAGKGGVFWPLTAARTASLVLMSAIALLSSKDPRPVRSALIPAVISGVADASANALFVAATRHGRLDVAAVLSSLYPVSTVILARLVLKERISRGQTIGIAGAAAAIALISSR